MAMNFHEFLLLEEEFSKQDLLDLAGRIFGSCSSGFTSVSCQFKNRNIELTYYPADQFATGRVYIQYSFIDHPSKVSAKDASRLGSGHDLQAGTMEGVRKFVEFARELKKRDIGIHYSTWGRRSDLYEKVMKQAGMSFDPGVGYWR